MASIGTISGSDGTVLVISAARRTPSTVQLASTAMLQHCGRTWVRGGVRWANPAWLTPLLTRSAIAVTDLAQSVLGSGQPARAVPLLCDAHIAIELGQLSGGNSRRDADWALVDRMLRSISASETKGEDEGGPSGAVGVCEAREDSRYRLAREALALSDTHQHVEAVNLLCGSPSDTSLGPGELSAQNQHLNGNRRCWPKARLVASPKSTSEWKRGWASGQARCQLKINI